MEKVHEKYEPWALCDCSLKTQKSALEDCFRLLSHAVVDEIKWLIDSNQRHE